LSTRGCQGKRDAATIQAQVAGLVEPPPDFRRSQEARIDGCRAPHWIGELPREFPRARVKVRGLPPGFRQDRLKIE
jgi:hypothetical protein